MTNCTMIYCDTHSHIYDSAFDADRDEAIRRAIGKGVSKIFLPAIDSSSHEALVKTCNAYRGICFAMMGLHPTSVNNNADLQKELQIVENYLRNPPDGIKFCGIGEIGLDLYWSEEWINNQVEVFNIQIELALQYDLPIVVHTRNAWKEMTEILKTRKSSGLRGVMHSFSGTYDDYKTIKDCGEFYFGIGGVSTYKNSTLPEVIKKMHLDDMVLETDSPYLPPVPFRGKRNESSYIPFIAEKIAEIKEIEIEKVAEITTANALRIFGI